jgi:hypothetical protein
MSRTNKFELDKSKLDKSKLDKSKLDKSKLDKSKIKELEKKFESKKFDVAGICEILTINPKADASKVNIDYESLISYQNRIIDDYEKEVEMLRGKIEELEAQLPRKKSEYDRSPGRFSSPGKIVLPYRGYV